MMHYLPRDFPADKAIDYLIGISGMMKTSSQLGKRLRIEFRGLRKLLGKTLEASLTFSTQIITDTVYSQI